MSYATNNYYKPGVWNVHCDVCGFKFKSDQVKKRWDGFIVCDADFELDHPQKYLRVTQENPSVPFVRKLTETPIEICYLWGQSAYAGLAEAGCAKAGNSDFTYQFLYDTKTASLG